jgi:hypothetical protein
MLTRMAALTSISNVASILGGRQLEREDCENARIEEAPPEIVHAISQAR